jgi:hypothetical protein
VYDLSTKTGRSGVAIQEGTPEALQGVAHQEIWIKVDTDDDLAILKQPGPTHMDESDRTPQEQETLMNDSAHDTPGEEAQSEGAISKPIKISLTDLETLWIPLNYKRIQDFKARKGETFRTLANVVREALTEEGAQKVALVATMINQKLRAQGHELWPGRNRYCAATDASLQKATKAELATTDKRAAWARDLSLEEDEPNLTSKI